MAYIARLTNGVPHDLTGVNARDNPSDYQDPYFNFQLPSNATNVRVTLVDDSSQTFLNGSGWLMVQRGQQPSSNSDTPDPEIMYTTGTMSTGALAAGQQESSTANDIYALVIPEQYVLAGEWFVSLDFSTAMTGGTLLAQWDHDDTSPQSLSVVSGDNGTIADGADVIFTLPASPDGDFSVAYWTISVPYRYTLTAVLNDNATGDIAASIGDESYYYALGLTINGDATGSTGGGIGTGGNWTNIDGNPSDEGLAWQNVPFAVSYTNETESEGQLVYINAVSYNNAVAGLRLMINCVAGTQWIPNSDYEPDASYAANPPPSAWILNEPALANTGISLSTSVYSPAMLAAFTNAEAPYPKAYLANYPTQADSTVHGYSVVSGREYFAYARFTQQGDGNAPLNYQSADGTQGGVGCIFGYNPTYYLAANYNDGNGDWTLAPVNTGTFAQPDQAVFLMAYEIVIASWTRTAAEVTANATPTWSTIRREVRFGLVAPYNGLDLPGSYIIDVELVNMNSPTPGRVNVAGTITHLPCIDDTSGLLYNNESANVQVDVFGYDTVFAPGDNDEDASSASLSQTLANISSLTSATSENSGLNSIVNTAVSWANSAAVVFTDKESSTNGALVSDQLYFLGITYFQAS